MNTPRITVAPWKSLPRRAAPRSAVARRGQQSGFAYLMALGLMLFMIAGTLVVLQKGATIRRRQREEETIWRGNQYARAIRLYYHKTGHYPQTMDDLVKGMPQLLFLRQQYKNPTNPSDGSWRFIYVNAAGQIIGSTRYATLQQMALMDANGGQLPTPASLLGQQQPGQPGVPVSTLSDSGDNSNSQQGQNSSQGGATDNSNSPGAGSSSPDASNPNSSGNPPAEGQNPQNPQSPQSTQSPFSNTFGQSNTGTGQSLPNLSAMSQGGLAVTPATLAAMALLKPTGPVDGPVLGGFLTGVACTDDTPSLKVYHGGKKYINWEFIWNPLEDAAAAMRQQMSGGGGSVLGQGSTGQGQPGGLGGGSANPGSQNPSPVQSNPFQQPTQGQPQQ
ncbi:MAG: hypothetical protein WA192_12550 [Candidatus Acidiferrales bacterium]